MSITDRRRAPMLTVAAGSLCTPSSSGPRWRNVAHIALTARPSGSSVLPAIPHIRANIDDRPTRPERCRADPGAVARAFVQPRSSASARLPIGELTRIVNPREAIASPPIARSKVPAHASRRSLMQVIVLCAALALALLAPGSAGAHESAATKLAIKAQRQQRRDARKAANEAQRSARQSEREARRAARQAERGDGSGEAPITSEAPTGGVGAGETHEAPPTGVKTQPATTPGVKTQTATTPASGCRVTAASSAAQITSGEAVTLSGKLTCPAGVSVEGQEVTVSQREAASAAGGSASSLTLGRTAGVEGVRG